MRAKDRERQGERERLRCLIYGSPRLQTDVGDCRKTDSQTEISKVDKGTDGRMDGQAASHAASQMENR